MTTHAAPALLMSLSDIAALARVQRPVVSVWRTRSAHSAAPFPAPITRQHGSDLFDAAQIGRWLRDTGRGNNPEATEDAAAYAAPASHTHDSAFAGVTALLALRAAREESLAGLTAAGLVDAADEHDPHDDLLFRETDAVGPALPATAAYVDALVEAAFGTAPAFERMLTDHRKRALTSDADSTVSRPAVNLIAQTVTALRLTQPSESALVDPTAGASDLLLAIHDAQSSDLTVLTAVDDSPTARLHRRRLLVHGISRRNLPVQPSGAFTVTGPALLVAQYPPATNVGMTPAEMLSAIEHIVLQMTDDHLAVVLAPSAVLTDADASLSRAAAELRSSLLRSGRVRAIVRLPAGLLPSKPQQLQALWVLGAAHTDVALADRWTLAADLMATPLTPAAIDALVGDLAASLGDRATVRAHAFRFARLVLTRSLLASRQHLVAGVRTVPAPLARPAATIAVAIDQLTAQLTADTNTGAHLNITVRSTPGDAPEPVTVAHLLTQGQLSYIPGNRIRAGDITSGATDAAGMRLIGAAEVSGDQALGARRIDRLTFAADYPAGRLTEPGDVVFCTSPQPAAVVDRQGLSVVVFPARILRIHPHKADRPKVSPGSTDPTPATPAAPGLLAEVLAADIAALPPGHRRWRAWPVRQVDVGQAAALAHALTSIRLEQKRASDRLAHLDELGSLLMAGVTAGTLTLASEPPAPDEGTP